MLASFLLLTLLNSQEETLYLEVTLPVIRPSLMIISDHGKDTVDFGDVVNGKCLSCVKMVYCTV